MDKTCNDCLWFVEETILGEYSHTDAVKKQKGFCLMKDFFTMMDPKSLACSDFNLDGEKENAEIKD